MSIIAMPKMGDTMSEGTIVTWIKKEGDMVHEGDVIAEIETEKAAIEIEAFETGILTRILVHDGETVPVGAPIAQIGEEQPLSAVPGAGMPPAPPEPVVPEPAPPAGIAAGDRTVASPLARRIARESGVDLRLLHGTGPGNRIIREDVEAWIASPKGPGVPHTVSTPPRSSEPVWKPGKAPSRMRQVIARRMSESKQQIPHFYVTMEIDMAPAMALRTQLNDRGEEYARLSPNDLIIKAAADTLRVQPAMRVSFSDGQFRGTDRVNIGIAVALPDGLIVPVLRDADTLTLNEIALQVRELASRARDGKLLPDDYAGGTFTISNLGMYGVDEFSAIVNPPEPGILAVSAITETPVIVDHAISIGSRMKATLSADHRIVDGATGALFLQEVKRRLENPLLLLQ